MKKNVKTKECYTVLVLANAPNYYNPHQVSHNFYSLDKIISRMKALSFIKKIKVYVENDQKYLQFEAQQKYSENKEIIRYKVFEYGSS
jgi:hypothetical protein